MLGLWLRTVTVAFNHCGSRKLQRQQCKHQQEQESAHSADIKRRELHWSRARLIKSASCGRTGRGLKALTVYDPGCPQQEPAQVTQGHQCQPEYLAVTVVCDQSCKCEDSIHCLLPSWYLPKFNSGLSTNHFGLVSAFISVWLSEKIKVPLLYLAPKAPGTVDSHGLFAYGLYGP